MADDDKPDEVDTPADDAPADDAPADDAPADDAPADSGTHDESVCSAAIAARDATIGERDALIATLTADLTAQKAANYDLLLAMPGDDSGADDSVSDEPASSDAGGDYAELFGV
jgi:hypothetical protein